jgi:HPt (histidine-containing phosphotransfer) domain-containing protein
MSGQPLLRHDERFERLATQYVESISAKLAALDAAITAARAGDARALAEAREIAHRMRGTAGCYGYRELGEAAGLLDDVVTAMQREGGGSWVEVASTAAFVRAVAESITNR